MTLDQLLATNVFSHTPGGVQREYAPFNEALTAQAFADAINSGKMSVEDAWRYYWTYEDDAKFWGISQDKEWRTLLPAWINVVVLCGPLLDDAGAVGMADLLAGNYLEFSTRLQTGPYREYNPFEEDATTLVKVASNSTSWNCIRRAIEVARLRTGMSIEESGAVDTLRWFCQGPLEADDGYMRAYYCMGPRPIHTPGGLAFLARILRDPHGPPYNGTRNSEARYQEFMCQTRRAHYDLKPRGYNPPDKKLVLTDDT